MRTLIFIILIIIGLAVFSLFYALPWAGEKVSNYIPVEAEGFIGEGVAKLVNEESKINDSANYYLKQFVNQLELDDTYKINVQVIESDDINAFALPGGYIFVYSGILDKMTSYEQLVALIGHEVSHVTNRHSLKSICRNFATDFVISSVVGDANSISAGLLSKASEFKQLKYSRELETEADNKGMELMLENKVDPNGMLNLLRLLKEEATEMPEFMKYLSTHPDTDSRIENILANPEVKKEFPKNKKLEALFFKLKRTLE